MIVNYSKAGELAVLFSVVNTESGAILDKTRPYWYADDEAGVIRCYDRDQQGALFTKKGSGPPRFTSMGPSGDRTPKEIPTETLEVSWTEYRAPIRIVAREGLSPENAELAAMLCGTSADRQGG